METELIWQFFSMFGDIQYWIGLVVGIIFIYLVLPPKNKNRIAWMVFALIPAAILAFQFSYILKLWFQVPRPCVDLANCPSTASFPSSHAAVIFAFAVVTSLNIKKRMVLFSTATLAILVAASRIALNYHTQLDVIAGSLIGVFCGLIIQLAYKKFLSVEPAKPTSTKRRLAKRGLPRLFWF